MPTWVCRDRECQTMMRRSMDLHPGGQCAGAYWLEPSPHYTGQCEKAGIYAASKGDQQKLCEDCAFPRCEVCGVAKRPWRTHAKKYHIVNMHTWVCQNIACRRCAGPYCEQSKTYAYTCEKAGKYAASEGGHQKLCEDCAFPRCWLCKTTKRPFFNHVKQYHIVNLPRRWCKDCQKHGGPEGKCAGPYCTSSKTYARTCERAGKYAASEEDENKLCEDCAFPA